MLSLVLHPNDILDQSLEEFNFADPPVDPFKLEEDMIDVMIKENGIGLAANQVGVNIRAFAIKTQNIPELITPFVAFNPEVVAVSEDMDYDYEGCLSFPNLFFKVNRPKTIIAKFFDSSSKECIIELTGIDARCYLHELDHLDGICFIDRVSKLKLDLAIKKQRKRNGRTK